MGIRRSSLALLLALPVWAQYVPGGSAAGGGGGGSSTPPSASYTGTSFLWAFGSLAGNATEANVQVQAPATGTYSNLSVTLGTTPGAGAGLAFTLRDAAADTTLTCSTGNTKTCQDFTHSASITQGDLIDIKVVATGTPAATTVVIVFSTPGVAGPTGPAGSPIVTGTNDTNVTLGLSSGIITPGWQSALSGARGGLGANASAFTGALWMASGVGRVALSSDTFPGGAAGNAATASALASSPSQCAAGNFPLGISTNGNSQNCTRLPQTFFGTAAPGSVAGNLPGDLYSDTTNHNVYWCNASSGTAAPACTSVTTGGWTLANAGSSSGTGIQKGTGGGGFGSATADTDYQSAVVHSVLTEGMKCDGVTDDTTAFCSAAAVTGIHYFPPNAACIIDNCFSSTNGVALVGNKTTLKHKSTSTTQMLTLEGTDLRVSGFNFDMNGVNSQSSAPGGCNASAFVCFGNGSVVFENSHILNSGTVGGLWGAEFNAETGVARYITIENTIADAGFLIFATPSNGLLDIDHFNIAMAAGHDDNGIVTEFNGNNSMVAIHDSNFQNIDSITGQGPNGNGIVVFQNADSARTTVDHSYFYGMAYTAVRVNQSNHVIIDANTIDNPLSYGEGAIYCAELGGEGCVVSNNQISHYSVGISDTNIFSRAIGIPPSFTGNVISNMLSECIHLENATATGNTCNNTPIGIGIGFGGTGWGNLASLNQFNNVPVHIEAEAGLTATPNSQVGGNIVQNGTVTPTARVVPMQLSSGCGVTAATLANPGVFTFNTCTQPTINQVYLLNSLYGMSYTPVSVSTVSRTTNVVTVTTSAAHNLVANMKFCLAGVSDNSFNGCFTVATAPTSTTLTFSQTAANGSSSGGTVTANPATINGWLCQVSASTSTTFTCGGATFPIDTAGFTSLISPPSGQGGPHADLVYSTGTTLNYSIPGTIVALQ